MKTQVEDRFSEYYNTWTTKLEEILQQLQEASRRRTEITVVLSEADLQPLISKVTSHLKQYYTVKWAEAHDDVLPFFSPPWLSPLENACCWVTGWKPSAAFRVLETAPLGMTEEQARRIGELRGRVRAEEERVEREMERLQMAVADRRTVELAKRACRDGGGGEAVRGVMGGLEKAMKGADCVRLKTVKGVMDVLRPWQCVEFLAAMLALQLRLRRWGKKENKTDIAGPNFNEDKYLVQEQQEKEM